MNPVETLRFPFLGEREDGEPFAYMLLNVTPESANIAVFNWMGGPINLIINEKVDLFIPSLSTPNYRLRNTAAGRVNSETKESEGISHYYEIVFNQKISYLAKNPQELSENLPAESSLLTMLIQLIKDILILKQGIVVYLKHLAPYFSRIANYSHKDYPELKRFIFDDLKNRIQANEKELVTLYNSLKDLKEPSEIPIALNLEYLRQNIESEMSLDLFLVAFAKEESREQILALLKDPGYRDNLKSKYYHMNYLTAIKSLEKRLYSNYNQIVLIYLKFI